MREKPYYSIRTGKNPQGNKLNFVKLSRLFKSYYTEWEKEGYFQEDFGYDCVDSGLISGSLGSDIEGAIILRLGKSNIWPLYSAIEKYTEDDLFDMIEFLYDNISKPVERSYHNYNDCGWHCSTFDRESGRKDFREKVNPMLRLYQDGFELSVEGEILSLPENDMVPLVQTQLPEYDPANIETRVEAAKLKYRRHHSSVDERRDAIRDLADVLEYLRPKLKGVLMTKDENDLFNIANNFSLRHHNKDQKIDYDKGIWYSYFFYHYLLTIQIVVRLLIRAEAKK